MKCHLSAERRGNQGLSHPDQTALELLLALAKGEPPWHQAALSEPPAAPSPTRSPAGFTATPTHSAKGQGTRTAQTQGGAGFIRDQRAQPNARARKTPS